MTARQFAKLKESVHFICWKASGLTLGSIRLSKIIFYADRSAYIATQAPMIADEYIRGDQGPYLRELRQAISELDQERKIRIKSIRLGKLDFTDYRAIAAPDICLLTEQEKSLLEELTYTVCTDYSAGEISEATHNIAWKMAGDKEKIPLAAQLVSGSSAVDAEALAWAATEEA